MDPSTRLLSMGAAGASGPAVYVEDVFSTWLYTGNGSTQTITNGIDLSGKGGLVWIKGRTANTYGTNHVLFDSERGPTFRLFSNLTTAQGNNGSASFSSTGFNLPSGDLTYSTENYVSWTFRKAAKFFDVVTTSYTGSSITVNHGLGSVPGCIIMKLTTGADNWYVYHRSNTGVDSTGALNTTNAFQSPNGYGNFASNITSTSFTLNANFPSGTYVFYLFAHDAGGFGDSGNDSVVKCGSYTGNGSTSGPAIDLGWEPQWVLIKNTTQSVTNWFLHDSMRGIVSDGGDAWLAPNASDAEATYNNALDLTAAGFQLRNSLGNWNASGNTYIYIAIRRGPMRTPTDATKVFGLNARTGTGVNATVTGGQVGDAVLIKNRGSAVGDLFAARLIGTGYLETSSTAAEVAAGTTILQANPWDVMDGVKVGTTSTITNASSNTFINYLFRRAPGFFDVVAYTGTGSGQIVNHNLGVIPELTIIKRRDTASSFGWYVWSKSVANTTSGKALLNSSDQYFTGDSMWAAVPTSTQLTLGISSDVSASGGTFIAYLFATCPGVSKCFSFTGTGTTKQIDCGFTNGARFVMIKRTDSTGAWYVWDSARGIISGNDPYLLLNSAAAEVTNTDYIDPYSAGFEISSTAPAAINANGGSYIGLAIA